MTKPKLMRNATVREKRMAEDIWLNYFNNYLYEHGTISEKEYKRMVEMIATRRPFRRKKKKKGTPKNARIQISDSRRRNA